MKPSGDWNTDNYENTSENTSEDTKAVNTSEDGTLIDGDLP